MEQQRRRTKAKRFFLRPWFFAVLVLLALAAGAAVMFVPGQAERRILAMEERFRDRFGIEVRHQAFSMPGVASAELLGIQGFVEGTKSPLFVVDRLLVDFDPLAYERGLPHIKSVLADGIRVQIFRKKDGSDNFSPFLARLRAPGKEKDDAAGGGGLLRRLFDQIPPLQLRNIRVTGLVEDQDTGLRVAFAYGNGHLEAASPSLSRLEKTYAVRGGFEDLSQGGTLVLEGLLNLEEKTAALNADLGKGLALVVGQSSVRLHKVTWKRGQVLELTFSNLVVESSLAALLARALPAKDGKGGESVSAQLLGKLQAMPERRDQLAARLKDALGKLESAIASMGYEKTGLDRVRTSWGKAYGKLLSSMIDGLSNPRLRFDSGRVLQMRERSGRTTADTYVVDFRCADGSQLYGKVQKTVESGDLTGKWNVKYVPMGLGFSGRLVSTAGQVDAEFEGAMETTEPMFKLKTSGSFTEGQLFAEALMESRIDEPPAALRLNTIYNQGQVSGDFELQTDIASLLRGFRVSGRFAGEKWSAELGGELEAPEKGHEARIDAALDSTSGLMKFSLLAKDYWPMDLGGFRVYLKGAGLEPGGSISLQDIAVARSGHDRSRAVLTIKTIRIKPSARLDGGFFSLAGVSRSASEDTRDKLLALISNVEFVEPHLILRQPSLIPDEPAKAADGEKEGELEEEDLDVKLQGDSRKLAEKVLMNEELRKALSGNLQSFEGRLRAFLGYFRKAGERFPVERIKVVNGRLEYAKAVAPEDRILSDLSRFYADLEKLPGSSTFSISASFMMPGLEGEIANRIQARINLVSGDMSGTIDLPALPLQPYRFLAPSALAISSRSKISDSLIEFSYQNEAERLLLWGQLNAEQLTLTLPPLSSVPLRNLAISVDLGRGEEDAVELDLSKHIWDTGRQFYVRLNNAPKVRSRVRVDWSVPDFPRLLTEVELETAPFQQLLDGLPEGITGPLAGMKTRGYISLGLEIEADSANLANLRFDFSFQEKDFAVITYPSNLDIPSIQEPFVFKFKTGSGKDQVITLGEGDDWAPLDTLPPWLVLAVTTTEDGSFFKHTGFNEFQWKMSVIDNLAAGRFARGASTISMQLVKNLFLGPEKTVARKLQELAVTWLLEREISKSRIMELYLNVIEWGENIYGIQQAARHYFGVGASSISLAQSAFLASFIPGPRPFDQKFKEGFEESRKNKAWEKWWERRLTLTRRIGRFMNTNCERVDVKCPANAAEMCRRIAKICDGDSSVFYELDNLKTLDSIIARDVEAGTPPQPAANPLDERLDL